ncbi:BDR-repeat family protein (plasmid) [Borrelia hermsii YBT]|uniref:BDR-repeat family protein n=1 Tax=Borrelia hermsii YBT TaxID=1313295 RepID=W5T363_BORHE|nr:BDR-repeat family protein [Borrelia hermsii YBT]
MHLLAMRFLLLGKIWKRIRWSLIVNLIKPASEFKSTSRLHNWMFGTLIALNIGIFLTLVSIVYSLLSK